MDNRGLNGRRLYQESKAGRIKTGVQRLRIFEKVGGIRVDGERKSLLPSDNFKNMVIGSNGDNLLSCPI
jgi:hypothetical protein